MHSLINILISKMQLTRNKKIYLILGIILLFFVSCVLLTNIVQAQEGGFGKASDFLANIAGREGINLTTSASMPTIIGTIINGVLGFLGVIFLIYIIYAGVRLMMAGGNEETVQEARATIKWALIGIIVVIGAYALSYYVVSKVLESTEPPPRPEIPGEYIEDDLLGYDCPTYNCSQHNSAYGWNQLECLAPKDDNGRSCCTWVPFEDPGFTPDELGGECIRNY